MERSPCLDCTRANDDKNVCARRCERLRAFRRGGPWKMYPIPTDEAIEKRTVVKDAAKDATGEALAKLVKITEQKPKAKNTKPKKRKPMTNPTNDAAKQPNKEIKSSIDDTTSETVPPIEGKIIPSEIYLDLALYPELRDTLCCEADRLRLPVAHVIISCIAEVLSGQKTT